MKAKDLVAAALARSNDDNRSGENISGSRGETSNNNRAIAKLEARSRSSSTNNSSCGTLCGSGSGHDT